MRRAASVAAVIAGVALVASPALLPAAGVTPPPMPAATPTGDWVPGWTPGATAPDGIKRPGSFRTPGDRLPQTGAGPDGLIVLSALVGLVAGGWLVVKGGPR